MSSSRAKLDRTEDSFASEIFFVDRRAKNDWFNIYSNCRFEEEMGKTGKNGRWVTFLIHMKNEIICLSCYQTS